MKKLVMGALCGLLSIGANAQIDRDYLMCSVYINTAVQDLTPLGAFTKRQGEILFSESITYLSEYSLDTNKSADEVAKEYVAERTNARMQAFKENNFNAMSGMNLYNPRQIQGYAKTIFDKGTSYCKKPRKGSNKYYEKYGEEAISKRGNEIIDIVGVNILHGGKKSKFW